MALDPDARRVIDLIRDSGRPPYETLTPAEARTLYREARRVLSPEPPEVAEVRELPAPGPAGPIPVRLYRAAGTAPGRQPALLYYHGGGWVIGDRDTHDVVCRHLANAAGCTVLSVDYRLAPEHKFPAAVDDAYAAAAWAAREAESLGIDGTRLAVGGDSAGGNLAAVVALLARDRGGPALSFQLLIYPATDLTMTHDSHRRYAEGYVLTNSNTRWFRGNYLNSLADAEDWRASPLRAPSLAGAPPAWVLTAGFDPLCDEGEAYAQRLRDEGVPAVHRRIPDQIHGFITMGKIVRATAPALDEAAAALKAAFAR
jgi:acetyl esterase